MRQGKIGNAKKSPLGIYNEHLQRGEFADQFSPSVGKRVFYPRSICDHPGAIQSSETLPQRAQTSAAVRAFPHPLPPAEYGGWCGEIRPKDLGMPLNSTL